MRPVMLLSKGLREGGREGERFFEVADEGRHGVISQIASVCLCVCVCVCVFVFVCCL